MQDNIVFRLLRALFLLLWKFLLHTLFILLKLVELIIIQLNKLLESYL